MSYGMLYDARVRGKTCMGGVQLEDMYMCCEHRSNMVGDGKSVCEVFASFGFVQVEFVVHCVRQYSRTC